MLPSKTMKGHFEKLAHDAGPLVMEGLIDDDITEIILNPDGSLWFEGLKSGMQRKGTLEKEKALHFIHTISGYQGFIINQKSPLLETELPLDGSRFAAMIPPASHSPAFTIRKKAKEIFSFADYLKNKSMNEAQSILIQQAIIEHKNLLIAGGPGSGKTTFLNACIKEMIQQGPLAERIITLEDLPEIQCAAQNVLSLYSSPEVSLTQLLRIALRSRPDRILVGEVRDKTMLDLLKAWNTGAPGGLATIHANSCQAALQRCCDLAQEAGVPPPCSLICEGIDLIIFIQKTNLQKKRIISSIVQVEGWNPKDSFQCKSLSQYHE